MALIDGLVSYYSLDGDSLDAHGANDGVDSFITYATGGVIGSKATAVGGLGSWIDIGVPNLDLLAISFSCWVRNVSNPGTHYLLTRETGSGVGLLTYEFRITNGAVQSLAHGGSTLSSTGGAIATASTTWQHIVVTRDSNGDTVIYVDGVASNSGTITPVPDSLPAKNSKLGIRRTTVPDGFNDPDLSHDIDEVGIWSRVITPAEVAALYNGAAGLSYAAIVALAVAPYVPAISSFDTSAYAQQLLDLLPPGPIWNREGDSDLRKLLLALGDELGRVASRGMQLIEESDPRTATETIADWERTLSLPDERVPVISSLIAERRLAVVQKLISTGGQSVGFFQALALACGYAVTVQRTAVLRVGFRVSARVFGDGWAYSMVVTVSPPAGPALTHAQFEAVIRAATHSHITVLFSYL